MKATDARIFENYLAFNGFKVVEANAVLLRREVVQSKSEMQRVRSMRGEGRLFKVL